MKRIAPVSALLLLALLGATSSTADAHYFWPRFGRRGRSRFGHGYGYGYRYGRREPLSNITLTPEAQPEGITNGPGPYVFVSHLNLGGIDRVNIFTGEVKSVVPDRVGERIAIGLWFWRGLVFAAGGGPGAGPLTTILEKPRFHIYDASTGEDFLTCDGPAGSLFVNDVTVFAGRAYFTSSIGPAVFSISLRDVLKKNCNIESVMLPSPLFNATSSPDGIVGSYKYRGLLFSDRQLGAVHYLERATGKITQIIPDGGVPACDGVALDGDVLYVNSPSPRLGNFLISAWRLSMGDNGVPVATKITDIRSPALMTPSTSTVKAGRLWAANANAFNFFPTLGGESIIPPGTLFNIVSLPLVD